METQEIRVQSLGQEDPLEKEMATHASILAGRIPWTEEPGGLQSMGLQRVRHDWATEHAYNCEKIFVRWRRRGKLWELRGGLSMEEGKGPSICQEPPKSKGLHMSYQFPAALNRYFWMWKLRLRELNNLPEITNYEYIKFCIPHKYPCLHSCEAMFSMTWW